MGTASSTSVTHVQFGQIEPGDQSVDQTSDIGRFEFLVDIEPSRGLVIPRRDGPSNGTSIVAIRRAK
jgi:hypothetical protein